MVAKYKTYSDTDFTELVLNSKSMSELMRKLGYKADTGRSRKPVEQRCLDLGLKVPHLSPKEKTAAANIACRLSNDEYFIKGKERKGADTRKRLISTGLMENKCSICGLPGE